MPLPLRLHRLWIAVVSPLLAPLRGLRVLAQLPSLLRLWHMSLQEHTAVIRELNDLHRELLIAIGNGPSQIPETPYAVDRPHAATSPHPTGTDPALAGMLSAVPTPPPPNPTRLRTSRDVTYSSRPFLREQDARAEAEQAPWRRPHGTP